MVEMEKSVKVGRRVYWVALRDDMIEAQVTTYPLAGYANSHATRYSIDLSYSRAWARAEVTGRNNGYAFAGHGPADIWTRQKFTIRKGEAKKFYAEVKKALEEAEDGTPAVRNVFVMVKEKVLG